MCMHMIIITNDKPSTTLMFGTLVVISILFVQNNLALMREEIFLLFWQHCNCATRF